MRRIAVLLVVCFALGSVQAQEQKQKKSFKEKLIHYLDSSNVEGTDPAYIGLPEKKWAITLNSSTDQMDLTTETHIDHINEIIDAHSIYEMGLKIKPPVATSLGFYVGYRGWGGGYSWCRLHLQLGAHARPCSQCCGHACRQFRQLPESR